ncbi:hypothetical protein [Enterovibrio nigricans]|uniref:Uncharacterized protein n=1 Tax=Enterovibrio nigricans DSM 22720 TaxID=1121868 RepID=A0A1T4V5V5_9GAMM|nr:hypothetical protein [Enterovibrio nigricans]PKF50472.1 hypothetical protein AT251_11320 [Enterovibrio nigricans]SKA59921.1 hypothetical protein SAMN02745132_03204 [Enterovibrio nigricans DSM 22720]
MDTREFDQLLARVNRSRKAALKDSSFIEQAEMHAKELVRVENMKTQQTKKRVRSKVKAPKKFSKVYEGFTDSHETVFHY